MKAFLLAGGRGERLRPLTNTVPKCLAPIDGQPLLGIWLDLCLRSGIDHILLNVSHHAPLVEQFLVSWVARPRVDLVIESEPLGSARTVREHRSFVEDEESFWIFYADNLTDLNLPRMLEAHRGHSDPLTVALFHAPDPSSAGIVSLDGLGRIVSFHEKPARPTGSLANAGIYLARPSLLHAIPSREGPVDFGLHVLPSLVGRMHGYVTDEFIMDVGTPDALRRAVDAWRGRRLTGDSAVNRSRSHGAQTRALPAEKADADRH